MQLVSSGLTYGQTVTRVSTGMESQNSQQQSEAPRAAQLQQRAADVIADESDSLREILLQAIDVRGEKPGFPPGLGRVLAERLG